MSFFADLKTIVSSSVKTISHSVEALAEFAETLERKTKILNLYSHIKLIEYQIQHPETDVKGAGKATKQELLRVYNELLALAGERAAPEIQAKKQALLLESHQADVSAVLKEIVHREKEFELMEFAFPIDEIRSKERLLQCYGNLVRLAGNDVSPDIPVKYEQLKTDIAFLQTKRRTKQSEFYPSGIKMSDVHLFDGKKDGLCEYWFESSVLRARCNFKAGLLHGRCQQWYEDSRLYLDANYSTGKVATSCSVYMRNGVEVMRLVIGDQSGQVFINLWDGLRFGTIDTSSNIFFQKLAIILRLLLSYKLQRSFFRARKSGSDHKLYVECMSLYELFGIRDGDMFLEFSG
jgi:hypothetical protein